MFVYLYMDQDGVLRYILAVGCVLSYVAVVVNVIVFTILCRKTLVSPATIMMQGLALADGLTAFCSYGLEPLYLQKYKRMSKGYASVSSWFLEYPYCAVYVFMSQLVESFHFVSILLTACLGIQKVVSIRFPIWTKCHLTIKKTLVVSVVCYAVSAMATFPRYLAVRMSHYMSNFHTFCNIEPRSTSMVHYSMVFYFLVHPVLLILLSMLMFASTAYISYKLLTNRFSGRHSRRSKNEEKSVMLVIFVLMIFMMTELPRLVIFGGFYLTVYRQIDKDIIEKVFILSDIRRFLPYYTLYNEDNSHIYVTECMKLFNMIGCMSNFAIYLAMSSKLRKALKETIFTFKMSVTRSFNTFIS